MNKSPEELEEGDVFMATFGFDASLFYCVSNNGDTIAMNQFGWLDDAVTTVTIDRLNDDVGYVYVGEKKSRVKQILSLGGMLYPRYDKNEA